MACRGNSKVARALAKRLHHARCVQLQTNVDANHVFGAPAVEAFATLHKRAALPASGVYRHPIPLRAPSSGEQYAFEVDLDACTGCKACVTACHALNGLDPGEAWRSVDLVVGAEDAAGGLQHVTSSCHHCLDPGCMHGCPANAYVKDPRTGVVRHLDDLCIGCRYCTFTCPYGAPQYVPRLGIVRKCDLCVDRLAGGEAPACVQGCPNEAIRVRLVTPSEVRARAERGDFLPHATHPGLTKPATVYRKRKWPEGARLADFERLRPEEAHLPLALMLVLTQASVGAVVAGQMVQHAGATPASWAGIHAALALGAAVLALGASVLHLGRPLRAWRAILGVGHSWLSREVVAFGLFAALSAGAAAQELGLLPALSPAMRQAWDLGTPAAGAVGLWSSVMLYHRTARPLWNARRVAVRFVLSAVVLGSAATLLCMAITTHGPASAETVRWFRILAVVLIAGTAGKLVAEGAIFLARKRGPGDPLGQAALLLLDTLYQWTVLRFLLGWLGGVVLPVLLLLPQRAGAPLPAAGTAAATALLLAGELVERTLFFRSGVAPGRGGSKR